MSRWLSRTLLVALSTIMTPILRAVGDGSVIEIENMLEDALQVVEVLSATLLNKKL